MLRNRRRVSESSSSSDSSDDEALQYESHTMASAGVGIVPYTAKRYDPADAVRNYVAPVKVTSSPLRTVTAHFNVNAPFAHIEAHGKDKGRTLRFDQQSGLLQTSDISYSHPLPSVDTSAPAPTTGRDFPVSVSVRLEHDADTSLIIQTPIKALKSESEHVFPGSMTAENPNGFIGIKLPYGQKTGEFKRNVTENKIQFMNAYPGQTAENIHLWTSPIPGSTNSLVRVEPPSVLGHFIDGKIDDPAKRLTAAKPIDGCVSVPTEIVTAAIPEAVAAMAANINYVDLSNKKNIAFEVGVDARRVLGPAGKAVETSVRLSEAFIHSPAYAVTQKTAASASNPQSYMTKANAMLAQKGGINFSGTMAIDYYHVDENFKIINA